MKKFYPEFNNLFNFNLEGLVNDYYNFIVIDISFSESGIEYLKKIGHLMQNIPVEKVIYFIYSGIDYQNRKILYFCKSIV